jgi:hypothetical protein
MHDPSSPVVPYSQVMVDIRYQGDVAGCRLLLYLVHSPSTDPDSENLQALHRREDLPCCTQSCNDAADNEGAVHAQKKVLRLDTCRMPLLTFDPCCSSITAAGVCWHLHSCCTFKPLIQS